MIVGAFPLRLIVHAIARYDIDATMQAISLIVRAGGQTQRIGRVLLEALVEGQTPEPADAQRPVVGHRPAITPSSVANR